ncbi:MAG: hypothetical protein KGI00_01680 [Candidatus Micrarchaeota archaeon]|nr:hypothetical protein [Candidatus Micrarchaeota archaeon]MDE1824169.1 hypothetical protein [Candidatus Micrarchaeota archaeon]MDE1849418.1 hypothetical protein [Candidatus Micrarchaeota archaeon]
MDLLGKSVIAAIVILAILLAAYFLFLKNPFSQPVSKTEATSLVLSDLQNTYPGAVINITNVTPSDPTVAKGSWHIIASVVTNATSPCPSYAVYSFDYPQYHFVQRVDNIYTAYNAQSDSCTVYGFTSGSSYLIASYPVAIARSYSLNISQVRQFVQKYGYVSVSVHANYYSSTTFNMHNYTNVWMVQYTAPRANYSVYAILTQSDGSLVAAFNQNN